MAGDNTSSSEFRPNTPDHSNGHEPPQQLQRQCTPPQNHNRLSKTPSHPSRAPSPAGDIHFTSPFFPHPHLHRPLPSPPTARPGEAEGHKSEISPPSNSSSLTRVATPPRSNDIIMSIPEVENWGSCAREDGKGSTGTSGGINSDNSEDEPENPPDGGYGWICVACCFMVNACTWGVNSAYGIYLAHYLSTNLHPSATPLHYAFIGGLSVSAAMLVGPPTTFLFRRGFSTRSIMALGCFLETSSLIAASFSTHSITLLFLTQGVLFGLGLGFLFTASIGTISQWFHTRRSIANGICAAGSGLGGLAFSIGSNAMIENISLEWSFRLTAISTLVINAIATILIRDRNKAIRPTQNPFDISLFKRRPEFALVLLWGFFSLLGYIVILFSLADYARSINLTSSQGSVIASMLSLGMMFGRPLVGWWSDLYGRINISGLMTFVSALTVFCLWMLGHLGGFPVCVVFAILNGAVCGTFWTTVPPVTAEIVGLKDLPSALSIVWLSTVVPTTFSEAIALGLRRPELLGKGRAGVYLHPQVFAGTMYLLASVCMYLLRVWMMRRVVVKERELVQAGSGVDGLSDEKSTSSVEGMAGETTDCGNISSRRRGREALMERWRRRGMWTRWAKI